MLFSSSLVNAGLRSAPHAAHAGKPPGTGPGVNASDRREDRRLGH